MVRLEHRDVLEAVDVEVGVELAVHHREHVLVELGGDALRVVVRGFEAVDVLHEIEAEQQVVVGAEPVGDLAQELARAPGGEVADRAAEERDEPAAAAGDRCRDGARSRRRPRARSTAG